MPTLFIHTGLHKTGTTSLQKAFFDNRRVLARQGLLYPDTGLSPNPGNWGHHELALALRQQESGEALWQALRAEADASGLDRVLVSSETLSHLPYPRLPNADASVDLPSPDCAENAQTPPSAATDDACNGTSPLSHATAP